MTTHTLGTISSRDRAVSILLEMQYAAINQVPQSGQLVIVQRWVSGIYIHFALYKRLYGVWTIGRPEAGETLPCTQSVNDAERLLAELL